MSVIPTFEDLSIVGVFSSGDGGAFLYGEVLCVRGEICEEEKVAFPCTKF